MDLLVQLEIKLVEIWDLEKYNPTSLDMLLGHRWLTILPFGDMSADTVSHFYHSLSYTHLMASDSLVVSHAFTY